MRHAPGSSASAPSGSQLSGPMAEASTVMAAPSAADSRPAAPAGGVRMVEGTTIPCGPPGNKIIDRIREVHAAGGTTVSLEFFPAKVRPGAWARGAGCDHGRAALVQEGPLAARLASSRLPRCQAQLRSRRAEALSCCAPPRAALVLSTRVHCSRPAGARRRGPAAVARACRRLECWHAAFAAHWPHPLDLLFKFAITACLCRLPREWTTCWRASRA